MEPEPEPPGAGAGTYPIWSEPASVPGPRTSEARTAKKMATPQHCFFLLFGNFWISTVSKELTWRLTFIQSHHAKIKFGPLLKVNIIFLFPHIGSSPFPKTKFLFFTQLQCQLCPFILFFCCCCCCCSCCCFVHQVMDLSRPPLSIYIQLCSWCRTQSGK